MGCRATPPRWRRSPTDDRYDDAPGPWPPGTIRTVKRHPALAPLSPVTITRSCSHGVCDERTRAMPRRLRPFLAHWEDEESLHFRLEEEVLLPAYAAHGDPNHTAVVRTVIDHVQIRRDVARRPPPYTPPTPANRSLGTHPDAAHPPAPQPPATHAPATAPGGRKTPRGGVFP